MKYEDIFPTPENIFERFCGQAPKFGSDISDKEWSNRLYKFFFNWGRNELGYQVWCKKEYDKEALGEWFGLDMLWLWTARAGRETPYMKIFDLALENENQDSWKDVLEDEVQKLIAVKALLKVLIYYISKLNIDKFIDAFRWHVRGSYPKTLEEKYLIILGVARKGDYDFYGYIFDCNGDQIKKLTKHVSMPP